MNRFELDFVNCNCRVQNPLVRQENITNRSAPQSGHRMRAALRSPHETASVHEGEPAFRIEGSLNTFESVDHRDQRSNISARQAVSLI